MPDASSSRLNKATGGKFLYFEMTIDYIVKSTFSYKRIGEGVNLSTRAMRVMRAFRKSRRSSCLMP